MPILLHAVTDTGGLPRPPLTVQVGCQQRFAVFFAEDAMPFPDPRGSWKTLTI